MNPELVQSHRCSKWLFLAACAALGLAACGGGGNPSVTAVPAAFTAGPATAPDSPSERPVIYDDRSYYLRMHDGTALALSLHFPTQGSAPKRRWPVMLSLTRYGRASFEDFIAPWRRAGYVVAMVDVRGSTSSFGERATELGPEERQDIDEVVAHLSTQPWSNAQVLTSGLSYMGDTADLSTSRSSPRLVGSIPRQVDFDIYAHLIMPGGVSNDATLQAWSDAVFAMDHGRSVDLPGVDCLANARDCPMLHPILQPVDGDIAYHQLRSALSNRGRHWTAADYQAADFRDDLGRNGHSLFSVSPAAQLDAIRRERKPVQYWGSWMDAGTAEAALARFRSAPEVPAEVWLTANDHDGVKLADPFVVDGGPQPSVDKQNAHNQRFAEHVRAGLPIERKIHYHVLGTNRFRSTSVWPPADAVPLELHFAPGRALLRMRPGARGEDRYAVDFTATTGEKSRWTTQLGEPPAYPDRRNEDLKLLTYDSEPMSVDVEVVGTPVVNVHMASASADPAVFVYFEDVAPDGRVTYITEGMLRAIHRRPAMRSQLPYDQGPAPHTFRRADALPVTPGVPMQLRFALFPTAALIRQGHRLRVAIAGADAVPFRRYSQGGPDVFTVFHGREQQSSIELTVRFGAAVAQPN